jgi:heme-degrading monooxygenase HmoA
MFVLHVGITMKAGQAAAAEQVFAGPFSTAIRAQEGFVDAALLRPDDGGDHILSIAFENQSLQQKWVATDLHNDVWAQMEAHFDGYTLRTFTTV